jgi:hypothetical protein
MGGEVDDEEIGQLTTQPKPDSNGKPGAERGFAVDSRAAETDEILSVHFQKIKKSTTKIT